MKAIVGFTKRINLKQESSSFSSRDFFAKLLALLMIIRAASWTSTHKAGEKPKSSTSLPVPPVRDDPANGPYLLGGPIFKVFGRSSQQHEA